MVRRDLDLIRNVDESLRGDAYDLLTYASRVLEMLARPLDPNGNPVQGMPEVGEMVDRTLADAVRQSDALLLAMAPLLETQGASDTALAARIREEARGRWKTLPAWLDELEPGTPLEITGVTAIEHVLGAASTIVIGATLPDGTPATATVFIDRDGGHTIEDAFVAPEEFRSALAAGTKGADFGRFQIVDIDPADARERVFAALAADLALEPPLVTETWPGHRSLLAWILRSLPEGGSVAPRPAEDAALDEQLVAATEAAAPGTSDVARLLISLNRERSGSGDPRLWSDSFVTDLLLDHLPFETSTPRPCSSRCPRWSRPATGWRASPRASPRTRSRPSRSSAASTSICRSWRPTASCPTTTPPHTSSRCSRCGWVAAVTSTR